MKNIIFFSKNLKIGGMEKALVNLLNELALSYNVTLVLEKKEGILLKELNEKIKIEEYKLSSFKIVIFRKISNFIKRTFWTLKNKNKYDFSCAYATYSVIASRLALIASTNSALYVHSNYSAYYEYDEKAVINFFDILNYKKFKTIIFVSNEAKESAFKALKPVNNFITINNPTKNDNIKALAQKPIEKNLFQKDYINLLFVGRLDNESKNFDLMLESLKCALEKKNNLRLFIVGTGPYKSNIESFIKENRMDKNVFLLGEKTNPYPYILNCDCLLLTSKYEGFPLVYSEALTLNQKVITTFPTSDGYIDVKDYFTCVKPNAKDIAKSILKVTKTKPKYNIDFTTNNKKIITDITNLIERSKT